MDAGRWMPSSSPTTVGGRWSPHYPHANSAEEASNARSSSSLCYWLPALSTCVPATSTTCVVSRPSYVDVTATQLLTSSSSSSARPDFLKSATVAAAASENLGKQDIGLCLNDAG